MPAVVDGAGLDAAHQAGGSPTRAKHHGSSPCGAAAAASSPPSAAVADAGGLNASLTGTPPNADTSRRLSSLTNRSQRARPPALADIRSYSSVNAVSAATMARSQWGSCGTGGPATGATAAYGEQQGKRRQPSVSSLALRGSLHRGGSPGRPERSSHDGGGGEHPRQQGGPARVSADGQRVQRVQRTSLDAAPAVSAAPFLCFPSPFDLRRSAAAGPVVVVDSAFSEGRGSVRQEHRASVEAGEAGVHCMGSTPLWVGATAQGHGSADGGTGPTVGSADGIRLAPHAVAMHGATTSMQRSTQGAAAVGQVLWSGGGGAGIGDAGRLPVAAGAARGRPQSPRVARGVRHGPREAAQLVRRVAAQFVRLAVPPRREVPLGAADAATSSSSSLDTPPPGSAQKCTAHSTQHGWQHTSAARGHGAARPEPEQGAQNANP